MGFAATVLGKCGPALFDGVGSVEVELLSEAMWLEGRSDAALAGGSNLALLGGELIQFGVAEAVGFRRFRLSRLVRGRMGTEWAAAMHEPGENFLLIENGSLAVLDPPASSLGGEARLLAFGREDGGDGAAATVMVTGEALRPPPPVHLKAERRANGDLVIHWVRRSRRGWTWTGGTDTPLAEEREAYRVEIEGSGFLRAFETIVPEILYSQAAQAADGLGEAEVRIMQLGTHGASRPAAMTIEI